MMKESHWCQSSWAGIEPSQRNEKWEIEAHPVEAAEAMTFGAVQLMHKEMRGGFDLDHRRHE